MPLSDEESLLCEEEQEDEFDLTEVVIHQADVCVLITPWVAARVDRIEVGGFFVGISDLR